MLNGVAWLQLYLSVKFQPQLTPRERVLKVRAFCESLNDKQQAELLSVNLAELRIRAADFDEAAVSAGWTAFCYLFA